MPDVYLAEMVCDWASRSAEFGTSLHDWIDGGAMERFGYKKNDKTYKKINSFWTNHSGRKSVNLSKFLVILILSYVSVSFIVFRFRHPDFTDAQIILHFRDAMLWGTLVNPVESK